MENTHTQELQVTSTIQTLEPSMLKSQIAQEGERRQLLQDYIAKNLVDGKDYGTIQIGGRTSKPCLFKAGAEKFCSLLQLRAEFLKDEQTLSMLSNPQDVLAFVCRLRHIPTGNVLSEGRGACSLKEKNGMVNTTIKIAEKRAQLDAVLRLGLSDSFTQDLDDMEKTFETMKPPVNSARPTSQEEQNPFDEPISYEELHDEMSAALTKGKPVQNLSGKEGRPCPECGNLYFNFNTYKKCYNCFIKQVRK